MAIIVLLPVFQVEAQNPTVYLNEIREITDVMNQLTSPSDSSPPKKTEKSNPAITGSDAPISIDYPFPPKAGSPFTRFKSEAITPLKSSKSEDCSTSTTLFSNQNEKREPSGKTQTVEKGPSVEEKEDEIQPLSTLDPIPRLIEEDFLGYNIVKLNGLFYGIDIGEGPIDVANIRNMAKHEWFLSSSYEDLTNKIRQNGNTSHRGTLKKTIRMIRRLF